jgi:hypothetical protein
VCGFTSYFCIFRPPSTINSKLSGPDFTVKSLTAHEEKTSTQPELKLSLKKQNWLPLLQSLLQWIAKFPPMNQLRREDRCSLLESGWHLVFLFHFMCQFGKSIVQGGFLIGKCLCKESGIFFVTTELDFGD